MSNRNFPKLPALALWLHQSLIRNADGHVTKLIIAGIGKTAAQYIVQLVHAAREQVKRLGLLNDRG